MSKCKPGVMEWVTFQAVWICVCTQGLSRITRLCNVQLGCSVLTAGRIARAGGSPTLGPITDLDWFGRLPSNDSPPPLSSPRNTFHRASHGRHSLLVRSSRRWNEDGRLWPRPTENYPSWVYVCMYVCIYQCWKEGFFSSLSILGFYLAFPLSGPPIQFTDSTAQTLSSHNACTTLLYYMLLLLLLLMLLAIAAHRHVDPHRNKQRTSTSSYLLCMIKNSWVFIVTWTLPAREAQPPLEQGRWLVIYLFQV